ncbi:sulfatase-like hydrolase/transferase [Chitinophaga agrisoli]|uniref:Sulfatase-like hydrolase/transferase n=2 Tax=Chitinophaga agrisoli TaxID=2607653 RepID=A0A5B2VQZ1_9BACT|nr:sulfatase-like hydrolase/transferase [Chitinophaga agrisoli]
MLMLGCCLLTAGLQAQTAPNGQASTRTLIVFFDGLRPDYITPELMPHLYAFKKQGTYGQEHHSVFPTVTRVNASSYSTGSYPATHGLMGNSVYFPEVSKTKSINTGEAEELQKVITATNGHLLTAVTLGELMQAQGKRMMVFSSGSTGQALLQNHTISGGAIINPGMILPASIKDSVTRDLGPIPAEGKHKWVTDALIRYGLANNGPEVSAIWYGDPDHNGHEHGIGAPETVAALKTVDAQFGRIIETLAQKGLTDSYNILISTDHGFATHVGKAGLVPLLIAGGFKQSAYSEDVVVAGGAIYIKDHNEALIEKIVAALQPLEWVGAIFTKAAKPGDAQGHVKGTLSFDLIHWNHERAADILVDANWDDRKNAAGYAGATYIPGVAGHGTLAPYDVHIPLIVSGPAFKKASESKLPTSNVDLVPTVLYIQGIAIPKAADGRVMYELLRSATAPVLKPKKEKIETMADYAGGHYKLTLERTILGKYWYVDFAKTER